MQEAHVIQSSLPEGSPVPLESLQEKLDRLSRREREVLAAVAYGYTNREIAERLAIGIKSIETYRYRVAEKLELRTRADLVRFALDVGLLRCGEGPFSTAS